MATSLPIIDYAKITAPNPTNDPLINAISKTEKSALFKALQERGFIYLKHPIVTQSFVNTLFAHAKTFFAKPDSYKETVLGSAARPGGPSQGWSSPAKRSKNPATSDLKEFFGIYRDDNPEKPNQWPAEDQQMKKDLLEFFAAGTKVIETLLGVLAEALGEDTGLFAPFVSERNHFCTMLWYPAAGRETLAERTRCATHTDYGAITLLFNDGGEGLQVRDQNGEWQYAPRLEDCSIVNIGDLLSRLFNGQLRSTEHRVIEPPSKPGDGVIPDRYSVALFGHFNPDLRIKPLDRCVSEKNPARYEEVVAGEHVKARVTQLHVAGHSLRT
ncbi:putative oxidoreductase [Bisporella sp. PMI_857]|nr:putative oxidoreductase [Bisporella sp. PMI_857]